MSLLRMSLKGAEELLLDWEDSTMAGMEELIFGYDGDEFYVEFAASPSLQIYDNGVIEADWSHNQGFSGRFWPYYVYLYDAETDAYQFSCGVEAWDRGVSSENGLGIFPEENIAALGYPKPDVEVQKPAG
ncbi:MAG: hypothetical protein LUC98_03180 [Lachnospiraceae bacterium]|nr:hypothetical protein [Lachnospiraceae bacterium]